MIALGPSFLSLLGDLAAPLSAALAAPPSARAKKAGDRAVGDGQAEASDEPAVHDGQAEASDEPALEAAEIIAVGQLCGVEASPPLERRGAAEGARWQCRGDTEIVVRTADGRARRFRYGAGTELVVEGGLLHLPPSRAAT